MHREKAIYTISAGSFPLWYQLRKKYSKIAKWPLLNRSTELNAYDH